MSAGNGHGTGGGPESRQVPSSTAQDRGACRPTTSVPCGEHACTPSMNRGSMSASYRGEESDVVIVVHDSESETGSISPEASPENRQGSVSVAQDPAVCRPSVRVQREDPVCRPVSVSLHRLDMPLDRKQRCRVSGNSQREENVSSGVSVNRGSRALVGEQVVPAEVGEPSGFACSICSRTFRTYSGRQQHTWRKHPGGRPRTVVSGSSPPGNRRSSGTSVCEGRGSQASVQAAVDPTASGRPPVFACGTCSRTFRTSSGREQHVRCKHRCGNPGSGGSGGVLPGNRRPNDTARTLHRTVSRDNGATVVEPAVNPAEEHVCRSCGRVFSTRPGLRQHQRSMHTAAFHEERLKAGESKKRRWSDEEVTLLAKEEIRLLKVDERPANVLLGLRLAFPSRTYESIRGMRKSQRYLDVFVSCQRFDREGYVAAPAAADAGEGGEGEDPEMDQDAVFEALVAACRRDVGHLCLEPPELEAVIDIVGKKDLGPDAPTRLQTLIDAEYDQFVGMLDVPKPNHPEGTPSARKRPSGRARHRSGTGAKKGKETLSNRAKRRRLYGIVQKLYRKNRSECAKRVLNGDWAKEQKETTLEEQDSFWRPLFEGESKPDEREPVQVSRTLNAMSRPVSEREYSEVFASTKNSSPGFDQVDRRVLSRVDHSTVTAHMNFWLLVHRPPSAFKMGVTVPIPKSADSAGPEEYRPITMSTVLCRIFHRVLAQRAERMLPLGPRQKAFRKGDGLADNVWLLQSLIYDCRAQALSLCITFVDVQKAFDTVSHASILKAAARLGFPPLLVEYICGL